MASMPCRLWFMKLRPTWSERLASPTGWSSFADASSSGGDRTAPADKDDQRRGRGAFLSPLWRSIHCRRSGCWPPVSRRGDLGAGLQA